MKPSLRAIGHATLIASVIAGLAACGAAERSNGPSTAAAHTDMSLIVGNLGDAYYQSLMCGAKKEAAAKGVALELLGPKAFDTSQQVPIVNGATAKKPDAIIIAPTDSKALFPPLQQAHQDGSKIITVDTTLDDTSFLSSQISANWTQMGTLGAQELAKAVGDKGTVLAIFSPPGVTTNDLGRKAFLEEMTKHPGIKPVIQYSQGDAGKSASIVTAALARYPGLAGVMTFNGGDAEGAVTGLREAGKAGGIALVAGGAREYQVGLLRDGIAKALLVPAPSKIGAAAVDQALAAVKGSATQPTVGTDIVVATRDNMDEPAIAQSFYVPC
ncbi:ABC transporter substrate-binding protein [Microbispora sp. NPDC088329]|uniref:ABC transporter substrate-binding protein n=1 Tax=Microbispora sp. NPDC088329 TaxID=3154869 RepID=UPI00344140BA